MIGIIGGGGNVGQWATQALTRFSSAYIKVGGRNKEQFEKLARSLPDNAAVEFRQVDFKNIHSVKQFAEDCTIILNCAGPTYNHASELAEAVLNMGIGYVDVGYGKAMDQIFKRYGDKRILCKAGAIPGLSGVLPKYLAQQFEEIHQIEVYYCALGKFTKTAAADYLDGVFDNRMELPSKRREARRKLLPLSINEAYLYPYYDEECEHVERITKCNVSKWFMALEGECTHNFMNTAADSYKMDSDKAVEDLCLATYVDTLGRTEYAGFVIQISGETAGKHMIRTMQVKAPTAEYMTGTVAAASALLLDHTKELKIGGELGKIKEVNEFFSILDRIGQRLLISIVDKSIEDLTAVEEGEI